MPQTDPAVVLAEGKIERPVEPILDPPMAAHGRGDATGVRGEAAEVVARFGCGRCADPSFAGDGGDGAQARPRLLGVEPGEDRRLVGDATAAALQPTVILVECRVHV